MKSMNGRTKYFLQNEDPEKSFANEMVFVSESGIYIRDNKGSMVVKNGNRYATAKIVRPAQPKPELTYVVRGWDMQMNTVKKTVTGMEAALDLACTMLFARIGLDGVKRRGRKPKWEVSCEKA